MWSETDIETFRAHVVACGGQATDACPVCGTQEWMLEGPVAPFRYSPGTAAGSIVGSGAVPLILAVCRKCFYVRLFAWKPIFGDVPQRHRYSNSDPDPGHARGPTPQMKRKAQAIEVFTGCMIGAAVGSVIGGHIGAIVLGLLGGALAVAEALGRRGEEG